MVALEDNKRRFIERLGASMEAERLPRIAGEIMALLLLEGRPVGFELIMDRLQVSRGSVSTNCRLLESLGMVEAAHILGDRRRLFRISKMPGLHWLESTVNRLEKNRELLQEMRLEMKRENAEAASRLERMERFYEATAAGLKRALESLTD